MNVIDVEETFKFDDEIGFVVGVNGASPMKGFDVKLTSLHSIRRRRNLATRLAI